MAARDLIVGGVHAARTTFELAGGAVLELWLRRDLEPALAQEFASYARAGGVVVQRVDAATLDRLYGDDHHQGVVLHRRPPAVADLNAVLARADVAGRAPLLLILDHIQDPRNFGACLRAADGAGVDGGMYPRDQSARLSNVVAKAASGALDSIALLAVPNLANAMSQLSAAGVWLIGTAHDGTADLYSVDLTLPTALVLGHEGEGLRRLTRARCDTLVSIPMCGRVPSLNVASAAAVCLFEARRQRGVGGGL